MKRSLSISVACALTAAAISAQGSLTTTFSPTHYLGGEGSLFFDITVNVPLTIEAIGCNTYQGPDELGNIGVWTTAAGGTYVGNEGNPANYWQPQSFGKPTWGESSGTETMVRMEQPFTLQPGTYGMGIYYTGFWPLFTDLGGGTQSYSNSDATIVCGSVGTDCPGVTTQVIGTSDAVNLTVYYNGAVAAAEAIGTGCGDDGAGSVYELFNCGNQRDMNPGDGFQLVPIGGEVLATGIPAGSGMIVPPTTPDLQMADDENRLMNLPGGASITYAGHTTNAIWIGSNGHIQLDQISSTLNTAGEDPADMRTLPMGVYVWWDDLNPTAGGTVHAEADDPNNPTMFYVTWMNIPEFGTTNQNTAQCQIDLVTGVITVVYGTLSGNDALIGYSKGCTPNCAAGAEAAPGGAHDFSAPNFNAETGPGTVLPLSLFADRPVIGSQFTIDTREIPFGAMTALLFSLSPCTPGVDLGIVGMDNCTLFSLGEFSVPLGNTSTSAAITLTTNDPVFAGQSHCWQAAAIAPGVNSLGVILSNAAELTHEMR